MANFGTVALPVSFAPQTAFPLDSRYYFNSLESAQSAASSAVEVGSSDGTYFIGENVVVVTSSEATLYVIQPNKTLKAVGSSVVTDNKTISTTDGTLSLKDFGVQYYKFIPGDTIISGEWTYPGTMPSTGQGAVEGAYCQAGEQWYMYTSGAWTTTEETPSADSSYELTQGFIDGLEPKVRMVSAGNFELAWYEPNPTTVEGLQSAVSSLQQQVANMYTKTDIDGMFDQYPEWGTIEAN